MISSQPQPSPLVTVGIPFYNAQQTLADAIRSVFAQTLTDWELILVNDGSADGSLDIAASIADSRVRVVSDGRNLGLSARLNQIARLARGRYLARMDADDLMHRDRLDAQSGFLSRRPEVDVVGSGMFILDESGRLVGKRLPPMDISARAVLMKGAFAHATIMGKVDWFRGNPYDSAFDGCEDRELWLRSFARSRFANIPECFYYCAEYNSFSLKNYTTRCRRHARAYRKHAPALAGWGMTAALVCRQKFKSAIYTLAVTAGLENRLLSRRSQPLTSDELAGALQVLQLVRSTALPLLSERNAGVPSPSSGPAAKEQPLSVHAIDEQL
jgi:glycosyltransferase involved in cell wall biosynthesis